jgi:hypothetical protein
MTVCLPPPQAGMARALITGGEDGKVMQLDADGTETDLARPGPQMGPPSPPGLRTPLPLPKAAQPLCCSPTRYRTDFEEARTIEGLAFAPKGLRIGMARYNGVSLLS